MKSQSTASMKIKLKFATPFMDNMLMCFKRLTIKEHVIARTSAGFWSDQTRTIHEVYNSTPFVLSNGKYSIEVIDALAAELLGMYEL